ncbi:hypothetical protein J2T57_001452 [Natronocella acetinitrilica]|uniref:Uncharacterized protein n=1 Tax=Natronocella acetinitrilica TaxID=414046 RepID=A0AAE3G201_9GAMM|nr:hypothetical protein [Natronocella acetinitrilica]MCP1674350.1 hypothetical protein [Natronocella acetinitrilica]
MRDQYMSLRYETPGGAWRSAFGEGPSAGVLIGLGAEWQVVIEALDEAAMPCRCALFLPTDAALLGALGRVLCTVHNRIAAGAGIARMTLAIAPPGAHYAAGDQDHPFAALQVEADAQTLRLGALDRDSGEVAAVIAFPRAPMDRLQVMRAISCLIRPLQGLANVGMLPGELVGDGVDARRGSASVDRSALA